MSAPATTRPGDAPAASTPATPPPAVWPVVLWSLFLSVFAGLLSAAHRSGQAKALGYRTGKYWLAAFAPVLVWIAALMLVIFAFAAAPSRPVITTTSASPTTAAHGNSAPVSLPPAAFVREDPITLDNSPCPLASTVPAYASDQVIRIDQAEIIARADIALINQALETHNVACATLATSGNFIQFTRFPVMSYTITNFKISLINPDPSKADGFDISYTINMADASTRPFSSALQYQVATKDFSNSLVYNSGHWILMY